MGRNEFVNRQQLLVQLAGAARLAGRIAAGLYCGQEQRYQDANDRQNSDQLNERKSFRWTHGEKHPEMIALTLWPQVYEPNQSREPPSLMQGTRQAGEAGKYLRAKS